MDLRKKASSLWRKTERVKGVNNRLSAISAHCTRRSAHTNSLKEELKRLAVLLFYKNMGIVVSNQRKQIRKVTRPRFGIKWKQTRQNLSKTEEHFSWIAIYTRWVIHRVYQHSWNPLNQTCVKCNDFFFLFSGKMLIFAPWLEYY